MADQKTPLSNSHRRAILRYLENAGDLSLEERAIALLFANGLQFSQVHALHQLTPGRIDELVGSLSHRIDKFEAERRKARKRHGQAEGSSLARV